MKRIRIIAIIIFSVMIIMPFWSYASFAETFSQKTAFVGFALGSTLDQSVNAVSDVADSAYNEILSFLRKQESRLIKTGSQIKFGMTEGVRDATDAIQTTARQQARQAQQTLSSFVSAPASYFSSVKEGALALVSSLRGANEVSDEAIPWSNSGIASLPSVARNDDDTKRDNAAEQSFSPLRIIERIIVRESSNDQIPMTNQAQNQNNDLNANRYTLNAQDPRINSLITNLADLTSRVDGGNAGGSSAPSNAALFNMIAQSQRIKTLDDVKITNATIEGYATSKGVSDSLATYLPLGGGTLTGGLIGTSLTLSTILNASSTSHFTATSTFGNLIRIEGTGTSTILGRLSISATSTMAGYKICTQQNKVCAGGAFSSSGGLTTLRTSTDLVGIGTSTPAEKLSINGGVYFDSDIIRYGSSSAPTLNFRYFASSTSTVPNLTSAFTFATSTTNTPLLTLSTKSSRYGRVGIGTSSPSALFAINALNSSNQADNLFYVGSSTQNTFVIDNHGNIGIGTSSRATSKARLGITGFGTGTNRILALADVNNVERLTVQENGNVGIGTTTPGTQLSLNGTTFFDSSYLRYGSSTAPNLNFRYFASSTSTIPNLTSAFTYATSTTNTPLLTLSTKSSRYGRVGIGTSSPSALFAINALNASNQADNLFYIGSSTQDTFLIDNHGNVGIGTSSRATSKARLAVTGFGTGTNRILALADANNNEVVTVRENGNVGIGTTSPARSFSVANNTYFGGSIYIKDAAFLLDTLTNRRVIQIANYPGGPGQNTFFRFEVDVTTAANNIGYADGSWSGNGADVAEWYPTSYRQELESGDLVSLDAIQKTVGTTTIKSLVKKTVTNEDKKNILGVISTAPGLVAGSGDFGEDDASRNAHEVQVALAGRVLVKVTTENGPIQMGDRITSSSLPGIGMKATKDGYTVGMALEQFDDSQCQSSNDKCQINEQNPNVKVGKILVFVNLGYSKLDSSISGGQVQGDGWTIDQTTGKLTAAYGLDLGGNSIQNVSAIMSASGDWRIDESGKLVVTEVQSEKLKVKSAVEFGSQEKPIGVTIYDKATGLPYCSSVINGVAQLESGSCGTETATSTL